MLLAHYIYFFFRFFTYLPSEEKQHTNKHLKKLNRKRKKDRVMSKTSPPPAPLGATTNQPYPTAYTATPTPAAPYGSPLAVSAAIPPPGAPPGGQWTVQKYRGTLTWVLVLVLYCFIGIYSCLLLLCVELDDRRVYVAPTGQIYDEFGVVVDNEKLIK